MSDIAGERHYHQFATYFAGNEFRFKGIIIFSTYTITFLRVVGH